MRKRAAWPRITAVPGQPVHEANDCATRPRCRILRRCTKPRFSFRELSGTFNDVYITITYHAVCYFSGCITLLMLQMYSDTKMSKVGLETFCYVRVLSNHFQGVLLTRHHPLKHLVSDASQACHGYLAACKISKETVRAKTLWLVTRHLCWLGAWEPKSLGREGVCVGKARANIRPGLCYVRLYLFAVVLQSSVETWLYFVCSPWITVLFHFLSYVWWVYINLFFWSNFFRTCTVKFCPTCRWS